MAHDEPFQRYMKKNYSEHFRRVAAWRKTARWVVIVYPLISSLLLAAPFAVLTFLVRRFYALQPEWFTNILSPDSQAFIVPALVALSVIALALGLFTGLALGISRARLLTFEA